MRTKKITENDIKGMKISSLPTRPTAPSSLGGRGYSSEEMRAAFDRLPLYIIERFNLLLEDIKAVGEDSLAAAIRTEIDEGHNLYDIFRDIRNGRFANYLSVGESTLSYKLAELEARISELEKKEKLLSESAEGENSLSVREEKVHHESEEKENASSVREENEKLLSESAEGEEVLRLEGERE